MNCFTCTIAAVEGGKERIEDVQAWLLESVPPFFKGPQGTFDFGGTIGYFQKQ